MFDEPIMDPTAGEQARQIRFHPELDQPILDPTDPRCEATLPADGSGEVPWLGPETAAERSHPHRL